MKYRMNGVVVVFCSLLMLCGCGGGGSDKVTGPPQAPAAPTHAPASVQITAGNAPFYLANALAVQRAIQWWVSNIFVTANRVLPNTPKDGFLCADGSVDVVYKDIDGNKIESVGDQFVITSPACLVVPVGGGITTGTTLSVGPTGATDARVQVNGTFEGWLLAAYGWSHHMQGDFRFVLLKDDQISVQSEGDVRLTLGGGQVLVLRNLAIIFDPFLGSISGQFDIFFESGFSSAALIQVDTLGALVPGGANVGPEPGMLQISGSGGAKARVSGRFDNNIGGRFTSSLDATGAGQFLQLSELSDVEFYSAFGQ